jgi:FdhD protein
LHRVTHNGRPTTPPKPEASDSVFNENRSTAAVSTVRIDHDGTETVIDLLAVEEPLELRIAYGPLAAREIKSITVTMRTPGNDAELAVGFLLTEGILDDSSQILRSGGLSEEQLVADQPHGALPASTRANSILVELQPDVELGLATLERNFYTTSSCGICGKASLLALRTVCPPRRHNEFTMTAETIYSLPESLRAAQQVFDATGGLHGAALFTASGELLMLREDVGRHNAVDKLVGAQALIDAVPLRDKMLMLSGRASFELLQKAVMAGIPMVAAVGAPSSLAVQVAREFDITLVGFLRDRRFNIYHGQQRILALATGPL